MDSGELSKIQVDFESHPPIESDLEGIERFLSNLLLEHVDCHALAVHLIDLKELTQVIAIEEPEEDSDEGGDEDEPSNDIYGVTSIIELCKSQGGDSSEDNAGHSLSNFLMTKCPKLKEICASAKEDMKMGFVVNERYANLPLQLSFMMLKYLDKHLEESKFSHLIFVSKVLLKDTRLKEKQERPKKKIKSGENDEPVIYINPEDEILYEESCCHSDVDVSAQCSSDKTHYIPHRRIIVIDAKKWTKILDKINEELKQLC